ncbi:MAG: HAMP domain-containing protein, partial [Gemmataceae bacterium]
MIYRRLLGSFALVCLGTLAGAIAVIYLTLDALHRGPVLFGLGIVGLVGIGSSVLLAYILSSRVVRPVNDLITAVDNMSKGIAKPRVYPMDQDEVSLLGETFNRMS